MSTSAPTPAEWRKRYEAIAYAVSKHAADLDDLFSTQPAEGHRVADCLGLRDDLRDIKDAMLRRVIAMTPDKTEGA